jgi:hypothetical protein
MSSVNSQSSAVLQLQANKDKVKRLQKIIKTNMAILRDDLQLGGILLDLFSQDIIGMDLQKELRPLADTKSKHANEVFLLDLYENIDEQKFMNFVKILVKGKENPRHKMLADVLLEGSHLTLNLEDVQEQPQRPIPKPTSISSTRASEGHGFEGSDYRHLLDDDDDDSQESEVVDRKDLASDIDMDNREDNAVLGSDAFDYATHLNDVSDAYPDSTSDTDSGDSSSDSADETKFSASRKPFLLPKTLPSRFHTESESSDDCYNRELHKRPTVMKKTSQSATVATLDSMEVNPLKSSALHLLCSECYCVQLENPKRVGTCKSANHRKVCKKW